MPDLHPAPPWRNAALALLVLLLFPFPALGASADGVRHFSTWITVNPDCSLSVKEYIQVAISSPASGIYRDIPVLRRAGYGFIRPTPLSVDGVKRNGRHIPFSSQEPNKGEHRVYMGDAEQTLEPGVSVFEWSYALEDMVSQAGDRDRIVFNVTGNRWPWPLDKVRVKITLPTGADQARLDAYQGLPGGRGKGEKPITLSPQGSYWVDSSAVIPPGEGVTMEISWSRVPMERSLGRSSLWALARANRSFGVTLAGVVLITAYFFLVWRRVGVDRPLGLVTARAVPPPGVHPAVAGKYLTIDADAAYVRATLLPMISRGLVHVERVEGVWHLVRGEAPDVQASDMESMVLQHLFAEGGRVALESKKKASAMRAVRQALLAWLRNAVVGKLVTDNIRFHYMGLGLAYAVGALAACLSDRPLAVLQAVGLSYGLVLGVLYPLVRYLCLRPIAGSFPMLAEDGGHVGLFMVTLKHVQRAGFTFTPEIVVFALTAGVAALFHHLLRQPTREGHALKKELYGFRLFLAGECLTDRCQGMDDRQRSELFVRYLPYALVLGTFREWEERFADILSLGVPAPLAPRDSGPAPGWKEYWTAFDKGLAVEERVKKSFF